MWQALRRSHRGEYMLIARLQQLTQNRQENEW
jgi:hypothetical protein